MALLPLALLRSVLRFPGDPADVPLFNLRMLRHEVNPEGADAHLLRFVGDLTDRSGAVPELALVRAHYVMLNQQGDVARTQNEQIDSFRTQLAAMQTAVSQTLQGAVSSQTAQAQASREAVGGCEGENLRRGVGGGCLAAHGPRISVPAASACPACLPTPWHPAGRPSFP